MSWDNDPRPSWDSWGILLASAVSLRGDCTRRQVGAVILDSEHRVVSAGYNGAAPGRPGCLTYGACPRGRSQVAPGSSYDTGPGTCIAIHAEQNAVLRASWGDMVGGTLYCTAEPCEGCSRTLQATPLARIVYRDGPKHTIKENR